MRIWSALAVAVLGCQGKSSDAPASPSVASGSAVATPVAPPVDAAIALVDARDPRCAEACLFLADLPLASARETYARACAAAWPYADTDCDALLFARNCIYAARGNVFKRPEWKARFEKLAWYVPRPDFQERDLSATAMTNIKALKRAYETCGLPEVTAADRQLIEKILDEVSETGVSVIEIDGVAQQQTSDRLRHHKIVDDTWLSYTKKPGTTRTIAVGNLYHAVGPGKLDEDLVVELTFDADDQLRAIELGR